MARGRRVTTQRTYEGWRALGYQVRKGEKATGRNKDGVATFNDKQVDYNDPGDYDEDMLMDEYIFDIGDR